MCLALCYSQAVTQWNVLCRSHLTSLSFRLPRERPPPQHAAAQVSVSTQTASDGQAALVWDELSVVGLPDAIDVQALFGPTGMSRPGSQPPVGSVSTLVRLKGHLQSECPLFRDGSDPV